MIVFLFFLICSIITTVISILFIVLFLKKNDNKKEHENFVNISVVIAFKNEEKRLVNLFRSLMEIDYPQHNFQVILIDDGSTDNSFQSAMELSKDLHDYRVVKAENKRYPGKRGALDYGISIAKYPFILITDADCFPSRYWLKGFSEKFNLGFDILFGLAPFKQDGGLINKISCYENLRSSILTTSLAEMNIPYSAAARNFGFTKLAYTKLEGYSRTLQTESGDDDLLLREAVKFKLKIGVIKNDNSLVFSETKQNFRDYLNQKARHTKTSFYYLTRHKVILGFWHSINIFLIISIIFVPLMPVMFVPMLIKITWDSIVIMFLQKKLGYKFKIYEIPFLQFAYELLLIVNFILSLRKNIKWKE